MQHFTPLQYLKIDIASNFGLDKETWDDRIQWFDDNTAELLNTLSNPSHPLLKEADAPALLFASVLAYDQAMKGEPVRHLVSLDATASGAQILAVLIGCRNSAALCNVVDTGNREDLYTRIYEAILDILDGNDLGFEMGDEQFIKGTTITRADCKQAIMTSLYGSKAKPIEIFGEGLQLAAFYHAMETRASGIWELNKALMGLWQSDALSHEWVLPDNFHVKVKVMDAMEEQVQFCNSPVTVITQQNQATETGLSLPANTTHSIDGLGVREVSRRCSYNAEKVAQLYQIVATGAHWLGDVTRPQDVTLAEVLRHYERTGFLSARVLELTDAENIHYYNDAARADLVGLLNSLPETPFDVLSVHDCFRVHPNYADDLRVQYNRFLYDLSRSDLLADIAAQITGTYQPVNKFDDFSLEILDANYALS